MTSTLRLPEFQFSKTTLANGLDVVVRRQGSLPFVAMNLWYHVGSKNEERRQRGYAHLFEHLMFEGSEHYPGDFFKPLQRLGAGVNGSTSPDRTNYFVDLPSSHIELAMAMESDRMGHLIGALSDHKLRVQKDVVKNEYRQNYANRPYGRVSERIAEALYPPDHPYSWLTIGVMEEVEAATRDEVEAFFRRFYVPANASLCLVGDIEIDRAFQLAERYFGGIPGGWKAECPWTPSARLDSSSTIRMRENVELERVYLTWHSSPHFHPDDAALTILADILTRGRSSRLYRELVVNRELAQNVTAYQSGRELAGTFGVYSTIRPGQSCEAARAIIDAEIDSVSKQGVTDLELERVKNGRLAGFFHALESIGGFGGVADRLNAYNTYLGDPGRVTTDIARYQEVSPEHVRDVAERYLAGRPRVSLTVESQGGLKTAVALDRSIAPKSEPARTFRPPLPRVIALRCGLPLWVLPQHDLPVVSATLVLGGGAGVQSQAESGLAQLTAGMMDEGTSTRTSSQIALEVEGMGASISASSGWDGSYVSFHCLTPHLGATLDLAVDMLRNPTFPETEWRRIYGQTLASLQADHDSAEMRAYRCFLKAIYPVGHPYRHPIDGDSESVARLNRDDLIRFHRRYHGPSQAGWVVAGDVDPEAIAEAIDLRLQGWTGPPIERAGQERVARTDRPKIIVLDRPGAVQAAVRVGHQGISRLDPDYTDALVANHILGGQFSSRLNTRLREEKGFTYGIRSHFDVRREAGPFSVSAALQADKIAEALDDLRGEIVALQTDRPPTPAELDDARRSLIESQARHFETPSALVSRYATLFLHGLPIDHHTLFPDRLANVTIASLERVMTRQIDPQALVAVVVADASTVVEPLKRLEWADLSEMED